MKKKIRMIALSSIAFVIIVFVVFLNIPFEIDFVFVDKFVIDKKDTHYGVNPKWRRITRESFYLAKNDEVYLDLGNDYTYEELTRDYGEYDIMAIATNPSDSIHEFNIFVDEFDFTDYYLVYTSRQPIKKVTFKYNYYVWKAYKYISRYASNYYYRMDKNIASPFDIWKDKCGIDVRFDESAECANYFYVYKIPKNQK